MCEYQVSKLISHKVAGDVSTTSWRNGLASETRLSTHFKKILATPLAMACRHARVSHNMQGAGSHCCRDGSVGSTVAEHDSASVV